MAHTGPGPAFMVARSGPRQHAESRQTAEGNLLGVIAATEVFLDQLRDGESDLVNTPPSQAESPGAATRSLTQTVLSGEPQPAAP